MTDLFLCAAGKVRSKQAAFVASALARESGVNGYFCDFFALETNYARQLKPSDLQEFDRVFEMDEEIEALYDVEEITSETIGPDFKRNQKIHRAWKIQHPGLN
jgi:protein-tyrosine-phosphatase